LLAQAQAGVTLTLGQRSALAANWFRRTAFLKRHHDAEDLVVVPFLENVKKLSIPSSMKEEHLRTMEILDKCNVFIQALVRPTLGDASGDASDLRSVLATLTELINYCETHFEMEEKLLVPLIRDTMTPAEVAKHISGPLLGIECETALDAGHFFSNLGPEEREAFLIQENNKMSWIKKIFIKFGMWRYNTALEGPLNRAIAHADSMCEKPRRKRA